MYSVNSSTVQTFQTFNVEKLILCTTQKRKESYAISTPNTVSLLEQACGFIITSDQKFTGIKDSLERKFWNAAENTEYLTIVVSPHPTTVTFSLWSASFSTSFRFWLKHYFNWKSLLETPPHPIQEKFVAHHTRYSAFPYYRNHHRIMIATLTVWSISISPYSCSKLRKYTGLRCITVLCPYELVI